MTNVFVKLKKDKSRVSFKCGTGFPQFVWKKSCECDYIFLERKHQPVNHCRRHTISRFTCIFFTYTYTHTYSYSNRFIKIRNIYTYISISKRSCMEIIGWPPQLQKRMSHELKCFSHKRGSLKDISDCIRNHLIAWQHLAYRFELLKMKLFKLRPKHHSLDHLGSQVARTRINPRRVMSCWNDESFLGYLKKIGIKCHVKTILERLYQRYILGLALRWQETKKGLGVWKKKPVAPHMHAANARQRSRDSWCNLKIIPLVILIQTWCYSWKTKW